VGPAQYERIERARDRDEARALSWVDGLRGQPHRTGANHAALLHEDLSGCEPALTVLVGFRHAAAGGAYAVSADGYVTATFGPRPLRFVPTDDPDRFQSADDPGTAVIVERRDGNVTVPTLGFALERLGPLESPATLMLAAALTAIAAVASLIGLCMRVGRKLARTQSFTTGRRLRFSCSRLRRSTRAS